MSDILSTTEGSEGQSIQEFSLWKDTRDWFKSKTCGFGKEFIDLLQLRDFVGFVDASLLEFGDVVIELLTHSLFLEWSKLLPDMGPSAILVGVVIAAGDDWAHFVVLGHLSNVLSPLQIVLIIEPGVIFATILIRDVKKLAESVEIAEMNWEPWDFGDVFIDVGSAKEV